MLNSYIGYARLRSKGEATIPQDIRNTMGISEGDRLYFIVEGKTVRLMKSEVFHKKMAQNKSAKK